LVFTAQRYAEQLCDSISSVRPSVRDIEV